jgi:hypothetical protein
MELSNSPETKAARRQRAYDRAHAWRGKCIDNFGALELDIIQTLGCLGQFRRQSEVNDAGFIRSRFNELKRLTGEPNDFAIEGGPVFKSLLRLDDYLSQRLSIAHGSATIVQRPSGAWVMTLKFRPAGSSQAEEIGFEEREAEDWLLSFSSELKKLRQRLDALRRRLSANSQTPDRAGTPSS